MKLCSQLIGFLAFIFAVLAGCEHDPVIAPQTPPVFKSDQSEFTDEELLAATYSSYKHPENFYHEDLGDSSLYYNNTISIDSLESVWIELSTDSEEQARAWSVKSSYKNLPFVKGSESEKYFEFLQPDNERNMKFRTHRSSYFTRDELNFLSNQTDTLGIFSKTYFEGADAKELIDYLWFVRNYNNGSSKVLTSFVEKTTKTFDVVHFELSISIGDWDLYDVTTLHKKVYSIDWDNRTITISDTIVRSINGKLH